jgi:hypothetical protein
MSPIEALKERVPWLDDVRPLHHVALVAEAASDSKRPDVIGATGELEFPWTTSDVLPPVPVASNEDGVIFRVQLESSRSTSLVGEEITGLGTASTANQNVLASEQKQREVSACFETGELPIEAMRRVLNKRSFNKAKPSPQDAWRYKLSDFAHTTEEVISNKAFAAEVKHFHAARSNGNLPAVTMDCFPRAMDRLREFPRIRRELLFRNFANSYDLGWRPITEADQVQLTSWLEQVDSRRVARQVLADQEQTGLRYTNYEYRRRVERLAGFAGRLAAAKLNRAPVAVDSSTDPQIAIS